MEEIVSILQRTTVQEITRDLIAVGNVLGLKKSDQTSN
jgi:hypothetical protein